MNAPFELVSYGLLIDSSPRPDYLPAENKYKDFRRMVVFLDVVTSPDFYIPFLDLLSASIVAVWGLATASAEHEKIKDLPSVSRNSTKRRMREVAKAAIVRAEKLARKRRAISRAAALWLIVSSIFKLWNLA